MTWEIVEIDKMRRPDDAMAQLVVATFSDKLLAEKELVKTQKNCNPEFESYFLRKKK